MRTRSRLFAGLALASALSAGCLMAGWSSPQGNDAPADGDPYKPRHRSKGEKKRNRKHRGGL